MEPGDVRLQANGVSSSPATAARFIRPAAFPCRFSTCTIAGVIVLARTGDGVNNEKRALFCSHPYARRREGPRQRRALPARRRADRRRTLILVGRLLNR